MYEDLKLKDPKYVAPKSETPKYETLKSETPKYVAPKSETLKYETVKYEAPAPKKEASKYDLIPEDYELPGMRYF